MAPMKRIFELKIGFLDMALEQVAAALFRLGFSYFCDSQFFYLNLIPNSSRLGSKLAQCRGSQPFSCHVPLQHFTRSACTPSSFWQVNMYPYNLL